MSERKRIHHNRVEIVYDSWEPPDDPIVLFSLALPKSKLIALRDYLAMRPNWTYSETYDVFHALDELVKAIK